MTQISSHTGNSNSKFNDMNSDDIPNGLSNSGLNLSSSPNANQNVKRSYDGAKVSSFNRFLRSNSTREKDQDPHLISVNPRMLRMQRSNTDVEEAARRKVDEYDFDIEEILEEQKLENSISSSEDELEAIEEQIRVRERSESLITGQKK